MGRMGVNPMSMRMVDLQTLLPRAQEASRAQEAAQRAPQVAQQAAAQDLQRSAEVNRRRVRGVEQPESRRVRGAADEERRQGRRGARSRNRPESAPGTAEPAATAQEPPPGIPGLGERVDVRA